MNYKALAIVVLLLLPMVPLATAHQPPMPTWNVDMYTTPDYEFVGPCLVSTEFPVDVMMWNDESLTKVGVYAFDFYVWWKNDVGISLTDYEAHMPWPEDKCTVVVEETGTSGVYDFYHLAATAYGDSNADFSLLLGNLTEFEASLATLTFHIDFEPCWDLKWCTGFYIGNENGAETVIPHPYPADPAYLPHLSTGCTTTITNIELETAEYCIISSQPSIDILVSETDPGYINATFFEEVTDGEVHTLEVNLNNVTGLFGFDFTLKYDTAYYDTDIQHVFLTQALPPPFETLQMTVDDDNGLIHVQVKRPCEKAPVCAFGYLPIVTICFEGTPAAAQAGEIPDDVETLFTITDATVYLKCYTPLGVENIILYTRANELYFSEDVTQLVRPKSPADLNWDGEVNIADLVLIVKQYGKAHNWADLVSPGGDVDIYDIVFVAKKFGDP